MFTLFIKKYGSNVPVPFCIPYPNLALFDTGVLPLLSILPVGKLSPNKKLFFQLISLSNVIKADTFKSPKPDEFTSKFAPPAILILC